jgi:hypothetical protein
MERSIRSVLKPGIRSLWLSLRTSYPWQTEKTKTTKKGSRKYAYWMATWREDGKTRNVQLESSKKTDAAKT